MWSTSRAPEQRSGLSASCPAAGPPGVDADLENWVRSKVLIDGVTSIPAALEAATMLSTCGVRPGGGDTGRYLGTLVTLGFVDATLARVVEPHLDAVAILDQAGIGTTIPELGADTGSTWGVYAAGAPGFELRAERGPHGWRLSGTKPWCSLAGQLSHAVITAAVSDTEQRAFAIRLHDEHVTPAPVTWVSRGLTDITTGSLELRAAPAVAVGDTGWYLSRPGFSWGGIGVAAVWFGIASALGERLKCSARDRIPDQVADMHLGAVDRDLFAARAALAHAASEIDAGCATGDDGEALALRVRSLIARVAEDVLGTVGHALGPGPLTGEEEHARRVADLTIYLRQHHGERDLARLGGYVRHRDG